MPTPTPSRFTFHLDSLDATDRLASALAVLVCPGDVVLLSGDLGAGKTTLVRRVAVALGADPSSVSSPTFTVMNEYATDREWAIVHMDAYRLEGADEGELLELGWDEAARAGSVAFIEWGERIAGLLAGDSTEPAAIGLSHEGETSRTARLRLPESWADRPGLDALAALAAELDSDGSARPGYPFATERDQLVDLYHWFGESYRVSRPIDQADLDES